MNDIFTRDINHDLDPDNRSATYGRPIVIEDKVWIGRSNRSTRCQNRLWCYCGCWKRCDKRCTCNDDCCRKSGTNHQEYRNN